ncbi:hypothetical protein MKW94_018893 [Papaver nudicaule]|uniref:PB1 domain-containing protein n=1 Tax=Papaver nudicaule TaxID=74823 RepID=A0AA41S966_PAPNU|nr:hypothetical protein [Papaver nudicaule]
MVVTTDLGSTNTMKFLCSYGGKILPRNTDGKLRYVGGDTRVLALDRSLSFSEVMIKLGELCGSIPVKLRCQLPNEDLDALISIKSDEDLFNVIEEYERASKATSNTLKIRSFLSPSSSSKSVTRISPLQSSNTSSMGDDGSFSAVGSSSPPLTGKTVVRHHHCCVQQISKPPVPYPTVHYYYENPSNHQIVYYVAHHHQGNNTSSNNNRVQY